MKQRRSRFWVRLILLCIMTGLIVFMLYQVMEDHKMKKPQIGEQAPNFQLTTLENQEMSLQQFGGKAVVLNFWASWCEPCRTEMPALTQLYEKYQQKGLVVLGVNIAETDVTASQFVKQYQLNFPIWMDRDREIVDLYKIGPIPSTYFIDPNGNITHIQEGPLNLQQLELYVLPILPQK